MGAFRNSIAATAGPVGLVTGSCAFAGLPSNPAELALAHLDGLMIEGVRIVATPTPVSVSQLPALLPRLVAEHRPVFVLALGLAIGAPVLRVETIGINSKHFGVPDNEGARPLGGAPIDPDGPAARKATWDAFAVVEAILAEGIPARLSFHAGTHLCNFTLYAYLGALESLRLASPCGFLHLPYLPEQIVWLMRRQREREASPLSPDLDLPSMDLATQVRAIKATLVTLVRQALNTPDTPDFDR